MFLGVDTSATHTGIIVLSSDGDFCTEHVIRPSDSLREHRRLLYVRDAFEEFLQDHRFAVACREAYSFGSVHRAFLLGEVGGLATVAMASRSPQYIECTPSALKKFAASDARADKALMCRVVERRWGFDAHEDDNLADAFALAQVARAYENPRGCSRPQLEVLATIRSAAAGTKKKTVRRAAVRSKTTL